MSAVQISGNRIACQPNDRSGSEVDIRGLTTYAVSSNGLNRPDPDIRGRYK
jgi:hypothetical protein